MERAIHFRFSRVALLGALLFTLAACGGSTGSGGGGGDNSSAGSSSSGGGSGASGNAPYGAYRTVSGKSWYNFGQSGNQPDAYTNPNNYGQADSSSNTSCRTLFAYNVTSVVFGSTVCWLNSSNSTPGAILNNLPAYDSLDLSTKGQQATISDVNGCLVGAGTGPFCSFY
jgi:hypothetical protein